MSIFNYRHESEQWAKAHANEVDGLKQRIAALESQLATAQQELSERDASFDLRWKADMRAIEQWQAATGEKLKWPNHSDLCVWLMQQLATLQAATPVGGGEGVFRFDWDAIDPEYEWAVVERYGMYHWQVHAHLYEPHWDKTQGWVSDGDFEHVYIMPDLPLGLDHRTLKQRRPHAQQETEQ